MDKVTAEKKTAEEQVRAQREKYRDKLRADHLAKEELLREKNRAYPVKGDRSYIAFYDDVALYNAEVSSLAVKHMNAISAKKKAIEAEKKKAEKEPPKETWKGYNDK